jgi:hypothetical protein
MKRIDFKNAYYIKLGRGGGWEESSIQENKIRIGWKEWPLEEINRGEWEKLKKEYQRGRKSKGASTTDLNALKIIVKSTSADVWVTFHKSQLWWCRLGENRVFEDNISKYRLVSNKWHNTDINNNVILVNQIPGSIAKIQRFAGTLCKIKEIDTLRRLINNEPSEAYKNISVIKSNLEKIVEECLKQLHWKDFEILVDLIFRNAGWRRVSLLGEAMKYTDIELVEPITNDMYQVQVKSKATLKEFEEYARDFSVNNYRKLYFVVHSPERSLAELANDKHKQYSDKGIELILPERLGKMVVGYGLIDWLLKKIR